MRAVVWASLARGLLKNQDWQAGNIPWANLNLIDHDKITGAEALE